MALVKEIAPYGTWESPISTDLLSGSSNSFNEVLADPKSGTIYLIEGRPAEGGRCAIVQFKGSESKDILPEKYSVRSKVHEYGGGASSISPDGSIIFSDANSSGTFRLKSSGDIEPLVDADAKLRYADFDVYPANESWIAAVQEVHTKEEEVVNRVVLINSDLKSFETVASGADFYGHPRFSHDGKWISWVQWVHPDMPWTGSELYVAEWKNGKIGKSSHVAGKARTEAVGQPTWHSYGGLLFSSDKTGLHQLYMYDPTSSEIRQVPVKGYENADLSISGYSGLGSCSYIELNPATLIVTYTRKGQNGLLSACITSGQVISLPSNLVDIDARISSAIRKLSNSQFVVIGAEATSPRGLYIFDVNSHKRSLLRSSTSIDLDRSVFSKPYHISFPRTRGEHRKGESHAMFTPPHNPSFSAPSDSKPPLIVSIHGGPTSNAPPGLSLYAQYWASRGYAHVNVNYAGSTGYGRKYCASLDHYWGIKDVDDAASCVDYLSAQGLVDGSKVGITGGSAGGYTVLQSLVTYPTLYAAGNSEYGIGNLKLLESGTHKFESNYLFALMFPDGTSRQEQLKIYHDRSPAFHAEKIESPLLLLQGSEDQVVPMEQSVEMERVLKEDGKDVKLVVFEGEGHGFRKGENLNRALVEQEGLWRRTLCSWQR